MKDHRGSLCNVAILVGGMGTRLKSRTGDTPKPMALLQGKPTLEHLIELCRKSGLTRIALLAGYGHEVIRNYFGDGSEFGVSLTYSIEAKARGTAGALYDALPNLAQRFFVLYGDTYMDVDLKAMEAWHDSAKSEATLFLHPNDHPEDSDLVSIEADQSVAAVHPYPRVESTYLRNLVNAALYIFDKEAVTASLAKAGKADIAKHALPHMLQNGVRVKGYVSPEYIKDMGTPGRLDKVEHHIATGLPDRLSTRGKRIAVFLDRDGTVNEEVGHLNSADRLTLLPVAASAIRQLNRSGILAILVTNQPVIARGELDFDGLERVHAKLETMLGKEGAYLDAIFYCPHHPDKGFEGERAELKTICSCRKPAPGMILAAHERFDIDLSQSWMIGDSTGDILAGTRAGTKTLLVRTGQEGNDGKYEVQPDSVADNIEAAVEHVLSHAFATVK
jgi:histidinol-phosphate phosphatase family protein